MDSVDKLLFILNNLPSSLGDTIRAHRKRLGIAQDNLAREAYINKNSVARIESGEVETPSVETIIALCLALSLEYELSMDILEKSGYYGLFLRKTKKTVLYRKILMSAKELTVGEANEYLEGYGLKPLKPDRYK